MEPIDSALEIVCDAGPLIHLDQLDRLDLLWDFESVLVPDQAWREVQRHRPRALHIRPSLLAEIIGQVESSTEA